MVMKEKLIAVVLLLILTAILPIAVSKCSERSFAKPTVSTSDTPEKPKDSGEILCALTAGDCNSYEHKLQSQSRFFQGKRFSV